MKSLILEDKELFVLTQSDANELLKNVHGGRLVIPDELDGVPIEGVSRSFENISGIQEFVFPESLLYFERDAITNCDVEKIVFGRNIKFIDTIGLRSNRKLKCIEIDESCLNYKIIQGNLYSADGRNLIYGFNNMIAESTKKIEGSAFRNSNLESIIIPDGVMQIGSRAFYHCKNLKNIKLGNTLTTIGPEAFESCSQLNSIEIPESVVLIENNAFKSSGLKELLFQKREDTSTLKIALRTFMDTDIATADFSEVNNIIIGIESFRSSKVTKLILRGDVNLQPFAFYNCKIEELSLIGIKMKQLDFPGHSFGDYDEEVRELITRNDKKNTEIIYFRHDSKWIEDRFW